MAMLVTTCYVTVRVDVAFDEFEYDECEAVQEAIACADYRFHLDSPGLGIVDTEICGINDSLPL